MKQSESILSIAGAVIEAKKSFSKAKKSRTNSHLGNNYATLGDVLDAIEPSLNDHDIMVIQSMLDTSTDSVMHMETRWIHKSGEWMAFQFNMPIEKKTAQAYGSTVSYCRRYALAAAFGVSQADDDAEIAKMSVEDAKKRAKAIDDADVLRKLHGSCKAQMTAAEWKIIQPYLVERLAEINAAANLAAAESSQSDDEKGGFNPAKPEPVNQVDTSPAPIQNKPSTPIEDFS